jgi:hypothetical protein
MKDAIKGALFVLLVVASGLLAGRCASADFGVEIHGKSWHRDAGPFNERNPGIGFFVRGNTLYGHIGTFKNSFFEQSYYVAVEWMPFQSRWVDAGIGGGGSTGYQGHQTDALVAPGAYLKAHLKIAPNVYAAIRYIPPLRIDGKHITNGLTTASLGWQWK